jgi:hypothetical protein
MLLRRTSDELTVDEGVPGQSVRRQLGGPAHENAG